MSSGFERPPQSYARGLENSKKSSEIGGMSARGPSDGRFAWLVLPFQLGYQLICFGQKKLGAWLPKLGCMDLCTFDKQLHEMCWRRSGHRTFLPRAAGALGTFN